MTNWKELIKKIKAGEATSYEQALFEEKRQEFAFFQEYLLEEEWDSLEQSPLKEDAPTISYGKMKRQTNRRLIKKVLSILLVLIGIAGVGFYVAQQLMDRYYYNPTVTMEGNRTSDLSTYELLYNELMFPDYEMANATVEHISAAEYRLNYQYQHVYSDNPQNAAYTYEIIRGKRVFPPSNPLLENQTYPMPYWIFDKDEGLNYKDLALEKVKKMPKSSSIYGYYAFNEPLTSEELITWFGNPHLKESQIELTWLSVKTQDEGLLEEGEGPRRIGMNLWNSYSSKIGNLAYRELNWDYPELFPQAFDGTRAAFTGETYEEHFHSLLQYLIDEQENLNYLSYDSFVTGKDFQEALDYVNENGVKIDGVYVAGNVEAFTKYAESKEVFMTEVFDTSLYSKKY